MNGRIIDIGEGGERTACHATITIFRHRLDRWHTALGNRCHQVVVLAAIDADRHQRGGWRSILAAIDAQGSGAEVHAGYRFQESVDEKHLLLVALHLGLFQLLAAHGALASRPLMDVHGENTCPSSSASRKFCNRIPRGVFPFAAPP